MNMNPFEWRLDALHGLSNRKQIADGADTYIVDGADTY